MKKDTAKLLEELKSCKEFNNFYNENSDEFIPKATLSQYLDELIKKHGIKKSDAIKRAELSEVYGYQIFSGLRTPERKKLISLAVGMALELDEIHNLLKCSGYTPLYAKNRLTVSSFSVSARSFPFPRSTTCFSTMGWIPSAEREAEGGRSRDSKSAAGYADFSR